MSPHVWALDRHHHETSSAPFPHTPCGPLLHSLFLFGTIEVKVNSLVEAAFSRGEQPLLDLFSGSTRWVLGQALQDYPGVHVSDLVILSSSYNEMQGLFEAVNRHAAAEGMRINASKTKVMSALIPGEQRQAVVLYGEPLRDVDKFKYVSSMFVANGRGHRGEAGLILLGPHSLACNPVFGRGVKLRCIQRTGSKGQ